MHTDFENHWGSPAPIKRVIIDVTASADVVNAVTGKKILVVSGFLWARDATGTGSFKFQSGGATALTPAFVTDLTARPHIVTWPFNPAGWLVTATGEKLDVVLATLDTLQGILQYVEVN